MLDVREKSSITDYMILATGTSDPHLKAMKAALSEVFEDMDVRLLSKDREVGSGWIVMDAFDFVIQLQTKEMRDFYRLEQLWKDAKIVNFRSDKEGAD